MKPRPSGPRSTNRPCRALAVVMVLSSNLFFRLSPEKHLARRVYPLSHHRFYLAQITCQPLMALANPLHMSTLRRYLHLAPNFGNLIKTITSPSILQGVPERSDLFAILTIQRRGNPFEI